MNDLNLYIAPFQKELDNLWVIGQNSSNQLKNKKSSQNAQTRITKKGATDLK